MKENAQYSITPDYVPDTKNTKYGIFFSAAASTPSKLSSLSDWLSLVENAFKADVTCQTSVFILLCKEKLLVMHFYPLYNSFNNALKKCKAWKAYFFALEIVKILLSSDIFISHELIDDFFLVNSQLIFDNDLLSWSLVERVAVVSRPARPLVAKYRGSALSQHHQKSAEFSTNNPNANNLSFNRNDFIELKNAARALWTVDRK